MDLRAWFLAALRDERPVPLRLHGRDAAPDGAPQWSRGLRRWLAAHPNDLEQTVEVVPCPHPLTLGRPEGCGLCAGAGATEAVITRWRWPLWRALRSLGASARGRRHLRTLAAIAAGRPVDETAAAAALRAVRARWRRWRSGSPLST